MDDIYHIIWTNDPYHVNYEEDYKEFLEEEYPDMSDEERQNLMWDLINDYLDDEKVNLDKELGRQIAMFGSLGLWYGRRTGHKVLKSTNLNGIFSGTVGDYVTWYIDKNGDVCCDDTHHDGVNHYCYRLLKPDIDEEEFDEAMYEGKAFDDYTERLGDYVADIYGIEKIWEKVTA